MIPFMNSMYKSSDKNQNWSCETHLPRMGYGLHISQHKTRGKTRMETDFESLRRDHQFQKTVMLECQLQEVKERQRRAQLHNQKLLQDFQKAQDTLSDVVALMEAMNSIRVGYERSLEEKFSKWQQKVHDKRLSDQRKRMEPLLKSRTHIKQNGQNMDGTKEPPVGINSPSSMFPDTSDHPASYCRPQTYDHRDEMREVHIQNTRSTLSCPDARQLIEGNIQNGMHPCCPFNLLSSQSCPPVPEQQKSSTSRKNKNLQNIHQVWTSSVLAPYQLSGDLLHSAYSVVQQESAPCDCLWKYPNSSGSQNSRFNPGHQCTSDDAPWLGLSIDEDMWYCEEAQEGTDRQEEEKLRREEESSRPQVKNLHMHKQRNKVLPDSRGQIPGTSGVNVQRRNERRGTNNIQNPSGGKEPVSDVSSSISDKSVSINIAEKSNQNSYRRQTSTESKAKVRRVTAVDSPEEKSEKENNQIEETLTSNVWTAETEGESAYKKTEEAEEMYTGEDQSIGGNEKIKEEEEEESVDDEKHEEEKTRELYRPENGLETKDGEEEEKEPLSVNSSTEKSQFEELNSLRESEQEEGSIEEDDDGERGDKIEAQERSCKEADTGSERELNKSECSASCSERNIHDSLTELYKNDTENEELSGQEAEDDNDDGDDDDDDVMVGKASPRTCNPVENDNIYQEDEDDDVEGLLAPQNNLLEHQAHEADEAVSSKDLNTDTEEELLHKKRILAPVKDKSEDSDDEFDHFYD